VTVSLALLWIIPGTLVALALVGWLIAATLSGLRGQEPFETNPGDMLRRIKDLEDRVARLEREHSGQ